MARLFFLYLREVRFGTSDALVNAEEVFMIRTNRAVKTGLLVTFIAASGLVFAQDPDENAPPPQFSAQDQSGPQGAGPGPAPDPQFQGQQPPPQNNGGWRR